MSIREKVLTIGKYTLPLILMVGLLTITQNGILLTSIYLAVALFYLKKNNERINFIVYALGFISMTFFESIFLLTGVETFADQTLFGLMPLWLPFLWAYGFLVIKDSLLVLIKNKI